MIVLYCIFFGIYSLIPPIREPNSISLFLIGFTVHSLLGYILWVKLRHQSVSVFLIAILFLLPRIITLPMLPWLSDDVFGYLWYGRLTLHGYNPFLANADSYLFEYLRNSSYHLLAYKQFPAIYPPLTEIFMTIGVAIGELFTQEWYTALMGWKSVLLVGEVVTLYFLIKVQTLGTEVYRNGILLFIFSPLPVIEIIGQGHNDGLLLPFLAILLFLIAKKGFEKDKMSLLIGMLIGCMIAIKIYPFVFFLPLLLQRSVAFRNKVLVIASAIVTVFIVSFPFFYNPIALTNFKEILQFYNKTAFNSPPLLFTRELLYQLGIEKWWEKAPHLITLFRMSLLLVIGGWYYKKQKSNETTSFGTFVLVQLLLLLAFIMISPKVHTWYLVPILLLNLFVGIRSVAFLLPLQVFSYSLYLYASPKENFLIEWFVWGIFIFAIIWEMRNGLFGTKTVSVYK